MIKINNITIKNYRSCLSTNLKLKTNLTALIGANGAGKSNILNSILLIQKKRRNRYYSRFDEELITSSRLFYDFQVDDKEYRIKADIVYDTDEKNTDNVVGYSLSIKKNAKGESYKTIKTSLIDALRGHIAYSRTNGKIGTQIGKKNLTQVNLASIRFLMFLESASYYSATQFSDPSKCPVSIEIEGNRRPYRTGSRPHDNFIYDLYNTKKNDPDGFYSYLNTVNENGIGLVSDIEFHPYDLPSSSYEIRTGGQVKQIFREKQIIVPSIKIDNSTLSPNQLSEGTFKTLALVYYILNDRSNLLLIEEPEVCVHHGLLNSILELIKIKSEDKQIIISTHSDFVLDKLEYSNLVIVRKIKEEGTEARAIESYLSKTDLTGLKDYLANVGNLGDYWKEGGFDYD